VRTEAVSEVSDDLTAVVDAVSLGIGAAGGIDNSKNIVGQGYLKTLWKASESR
jgi:hypothetical protein